MDFKTLKSEQLVKIIKNGGVGVLPTDTIYGLVARALDKRTIERVYKIKGRSYNKPLIVFITSIKGLSLFDVKLDVNTKKVLKKVWPGMVSVVLPVPRKKFEYLHQGTKTIAFRYIVKPELAAFVRKTGPIVGTSANPQGLPSAKTLDEAKKYFGNTLDFYVNGGWLEALPSTLISIKDGEIKILRQGEVKVKT